MDINLKAQGLNHIRIPPFLSKLESVLLNNKFLVSLIKFLKRYMVNNHKMSYHSHNLLIPE